MDLKGFYAGFAPCYHLIYPDWEASMKRQASELDGVIRENWGEGVQTVLDVSCGNGTQSLGLAKLGYRVTASDLSPDEVERAKAEARKRGLEIPFSAADMRQAHDHHRAQFDLVISCDNAVPHLLADEDILLAFSQMHACTRPGGGCLISVRDYEKEDLRGPKVKCYEPREENGVRYIIFQVRDTHGDIYDLDVYIVEDRGEPECRTRVLRSQYNTIGITRLIDLMTQAGFKDVQRLDGRFFQPLIIGTRP